MPAFFGIGEITERITFFLFFLVFWLLSLGFHYQILALAELHYIFIYGHCHYILTFPVRLAELDA